MAALRSTEKLIKMQYTAGPRKRGFLCPFGRVLTTEGRVRSGNGTSYFLSKFMNVVLSVKLSQLLKRHRMIEITVVG